MKKTLIILSLYMLNSCSHTVTIEPNKTYKIYDKVPTDNGYCDVYWFDEYKLRKNRVKCDSCYIGQKIGEGGLKL